MVTTCQMKNADTGISAVPRKSRRTGNMVRRVYTTILGCGKAPLGYQSQCRALHLYHPNRSTGITSPHAHGHRQTKMRTVPRSQCLEGPVNLLPWILPQLLAPRPRADPGAGGCRRLKTQRPKSHPANPAQRRETLLLRTRRSRRHGAGQPRVTTLSVPQLDLVNIAPQQQSTAQRETHHGSQPCTSLIHDYPRINKYCPLTRANCNKSSGPRKAKRQLHMIVNLHRLQLRLILPVVRTRPRRQRSRASNRTS